MFGRSLRSVSTGVHPRDEHGMVAQLHGRSPSSFQPVAAPEFVGALFLEDALEGTSLKSTTMFFFCDSHFPRCSAWVVTIVKRSALLILKRVQGSVLGEGSGLNSDAGAHSLSRNCVACVA